MIDSVKSGNLWHRFGLIVAVAVISGCASQGQAPVRDRTPPPPAAAPPVAPPAAPGTPGTPVVEQMHVVRPGETLRGIARLYGRDVKDLAAWNNLSDPNQIHVGQTIRVSPPAEAIAQPIAIPRPVDVQPVVPGGEVTGTQVKQEPKGGRKPYSDEAWAAIQPRPAPLPPTLPTQPEIPGAARDSQWLWPASGPVLGGFNEATNKGVDIAGKPGDPVYASAAGKVVYSGSGLRGYGKLVIIKHDTDFLTAYAHNQNLLVKEGESVAKGQKIAELGSTDADRPKLHFEIRKQGRPVDPMKYLPAR